MSLQEADDVSATIGEKESGKRRANMVHTCMHAVSGGATANASVAAAYVRRRHCTLPRYAVLSRSRANK